MTLDPERLSALTDPAEGESGPVWSRAREDAVLDRLRQHDARSSARTRARLVAFVGLAAAAVAVLAVGIRWDGGPRQADETIAVSAEPRPLRFRDGTSITPLDATADVVVATASDALMEVQLRGGGARFDVTPDQSRRFRVDAGLVTVDVLGTEFDVVRDDDRVQVHVLRGRVQVTWPGGAQTLARGESGSFPPVVAQREAPPDPGPFADRGDPPDEPDPAAPSPGDAPRPAEESMPTQSRKPTSTGSGKRRDDESPGNVEALMHAADDARRAGNAAQAIESLTRVLEEHPEDRRAALAAFTIGRIELSRKRYRAAAGYFAKVRAMGQTSLAEHALAREVEAWAAAGEGNKAQQRATEYLLQYPDGPRAAQVRRIAGEAGG